MSRSVGGSPGPLTGTDFSVQEIWKMSQRSNQVWGLESYEVPVIHYDAAKMKREAEEYKRATGKEKAKKPGKLDMNIKRGGAFKHVEKHSLAVPAPWMYDIKEKWITGYQNMRLGDITPRAAKKLKYRWLSTPADNQNFDKAGAIKQAKLNMDVIFQIKHQFNTNYSARRTLSLIRSSILTRRRCILCQVLVLTTWTKSLQRNFTPNIRI